MMTTVVVWLALLPLCLCLDYGDLRVCSVSGDLLKPSLWSDVTFNLAKQFRLRNLAYSRALGVPRDPRLFPEEFLLSRAKRRQKRDVVVSRVGEQVTSMAVGVYRQERMLIPEVSSVVSESLTTTGEVTSSFIVGYQQEDGSLLDLKVDVSPAGVVTFHHAAWNDQDLQVDLVSSPLTPVGGSPLTIPLDGAKITDIEVGRDPQSGISYLAVMVDQALDWPSQAQRDSDESMAVNKPIAMPDTGRSKIYEFNLPDSSTYSFEQVMTVPSIEAKDGAFFVVDHALHLVIAHRGNYTLSSRTSEAIHLRLEKGLEKGVASTFNIIQGYRGIGADGEQLETDLSFTTQGPDRVIHFELHNRDFVVFANTDSRSYSNSEEFSYIYKYKFDKEGRSGKYKMFQKLPTFKAVDVTFVPIEDPYNPLNSQYFLIFANSEDVNGTEVDSFVFKWIDGKFLPFQSLQLPDKPLSVSSFEKRVQEDSEGKKIDILQEFIVFVLENGEMKFFQFDGHIFQEVFPSQTVPSLSQDGPTVTSVTTREMDQKIILNLRYSNGVLHQAKVELDTASVVNKGYSSSGKFRDYVDHHLSRLPDTRSVYNSFLTSPRRSDGTIQLESVTFSGSLSVDDINVVAGMLETPGDQTTFAVDGKTSIDASLITDLEKLSTGGETMYANNIEAINVVMEEYEKKIDVSVKTNQANEIRNEVLFHNLVVTDTLKVDNTLVDIEDENIRDIFTSDGSTFYDLVEYMEAAIYLGNSDDIIISHPMTFENLRIAGNYIVHNLNGLSLTLYWHSDDSVTVPGITTLSAGATLAGASYVAGTVAGRDFTEETLLLQAGDQTLAGHWTFSGELSLPDILTSTINGFDLSLIDSVVTYTDDHILMNQVDTIYLDHLILPVISHDTIDVLNTEFPHSKKSEVHMTDLMGKSFLKDGGGDVLLSYDFTDDVTISGVMLEELNDVQFPEGFVPFNDPNCLVECNGTLILDNVFGVELSVASNITSGSWRYSGEGDVIQDSVDGTVQVDSDGNLELLLLGPTTLSSYSHSVSSRKDFPSVHFMENVTVNSLVLGYNMTRLAAEQEAGVSLLTEDLSIPELTLSSVDALDRLVLSDSLIYVNEMMINMTDVFSSAMEREVSTWPSSISSVLFSNQAEFLDDINVSSLNTFDDDFTSVDPEHDFLRVFGPPITFSQPVTFTEDVSFTSDLLQDTENFNVQACRLGYDEQCLCSDCSDPRCELIGGDCVVTDVGNVDTNLYTNIRSVTLDYFDDNSLKLTGDQVILPKLVFKGGFTAVDLNVTTTDCQINMIACDDIALTNTEQTFTGLNTFHGSLYLNSEAVINNVLNVGGTVDNEDLDHVYSDSLYQALENVTQHISQVHVFNENIFIDSLRTNDNYLSVSGRDVNPSELFSDDYVLTSSAEAVISGNLIFEENIELTSIEVTSESVTWDGVTLDNFFHNLLLNNGSDQTVSGDVNVPGSLTVSAGLVKANTEAETKINQVDIVDLDNRALRISGVSLPPERTSLGDVHFGIFETTPGVGVLLDGAFLGVDISREAVTKTNNSTLVITATHEFSGGLEVAAEVTVSGTVESLRDSSENFVKEELVQFVEGDPSVTRVRVTHEAGARAELEPVMTLVNNVNLASLRSDKWHAQDDIDLHYNVSLENADFTGSLEVNKLNSIDLSLWRDTYLSLSRHQIISGSYSFNSDLVVSGDLSVEKVFVGEAGGTEGTLRTLATSTREATEHQFADRYFKVLFRNISHDSITTVLSPDTTKVNENVLLDSGLMINGVDLSENVLTYKFGDMKTFTNSLTVTGDLKIVSGSSGAGDVNLNNYLVLLDETSDDALISVIPSDRYLHAVKQSDVDTNPIEIHGDVEISETPTFSDMILDPGSTINSASIGSCERPEILTTDNCGVSSDQIITTKLTFNVPGNDRDLTVAALLLSSSESLLNEKNWEQEVEEMISKTAVENVTITHMKAFYQSEFAVESSVPVRVTSTLFGLSSDSREKIHDMTFPSGLIPAVSVSVDESEDRKPDMPDLVTALSNIQHNSRELPAQFLYFTPLMTETAGDKRVKNIDVFTGRGLLPDNPTIADWEAMPFHMVTFMADVDTESVSLTFSKLSQLDGDIEISPLTSPGSLSTSLTYRGTGGHLEMGDMVALRHDSWYYLLTTLTSDTFVSESLVDGIPLNNGSVVLLLKWNDEDSQLETVQSMKENWNDLNHIHFANQNCVVGCGVDSQILCFSSGTSNSNPVQYLDSSQDLADLGECFKASSVEIEDGSSKEDLLVIASNYNSDAGLVTVLKYQQDSGRFSDIQTIPCYYCSFADVGKYEEEVFIVIMSDSTNFIYIGKYDERQEKFVIFQNLDLVKPQEAYFYNRDGNLLLSVLAKVNERREIFTFEYQGSMSFVEDKEKTVNLLGVQSHNILSHSLLGSELISTSGVPAPGRILSANSLLQATYKQTDIAAVREELNASPVPQPLMISEECKDMVLSYVERLYHSHGGPEDPKTFAKPIQEMYENAERSLMISNRAEAYIIFYAYKDFANHRLRDIDSSGFRGTGLVFQDKDGVLFMRFRIMEAPYSGHDYRGFSILESCSASQAIDFNNTFSSGNDRSYTPTESSVPGAGEEVQEICLMVHDFPLVSDLHHLSGSGDVGAVSLQDSAGHTFACGYMKHPQQAMVTLMEKHPELVDDQRLVLQN